jgi:hypothetical protein
MNKLCPPVRLFWIFLPSLLEQSDLESELFLFVFLLDELANSLVDALFHPGHLDLRERRFAKALDLKVCQLRERKLIRCRDVIEASVFS